MIINLRSLLQHRNLFYSVIGLLAISATYIQVADVIADGPIAIAGVRTDQKVVALTFDHSWGNKFTPSILDTLQTNNLKVTFFIMGPWAQKYPEVAQRMAKDGHEIASHGYRHENYGDKTAEWVKSDIEKAHAQIKEVTGVEPKLLRPPNGHYSQQSLKTTDELGYKTIIWNVDSLDWKNPGRDVIVERVAKRLKPGAIILLHASDTPVQTAEALPILIEKIKSEGYQIVTVGELLTKYADKGIQRH
ncbi:polysaccharide deacetylase family sporulation protein PdaB|uniref:Polysaccharide deacetylase family sporulation protein PdaB n=1 Tax=Dendrosporobacter quercicolus TaxID=146817 RepID=A0A1G9P5H1_9FIRM|nr:polysaccharide deacetylase family sporulation protein PdaB [Dendrosporobacter quercicolus]NSL47549.1 polysaccharide deacetylase family sporulation protein PdaB [Dendrosporobacter quercicolus DSM 1736]SDL93969.1 polysaccharide deacetylase family sporulation protein PdaB [Dendrosporobacter quercicolus]